MKNFTDNTCICGEGYSDGSCCGYTAKCSICGKPSPSGNDHWDCELGVAETARVEHERLQTKEAENAPYLQKQIGKPRERTTCGNIRF